MLVISSSRPSYAKLRYGFGDAEEDLCIISTSVLALAGFLGKEKEVVGS